MSRSLGRLYLNPPDPADPEEVIQRAFAQWCKCHLAEDVFWFSVPNEGTGGKAFLGRMKLMGMRAGVADFALIHAGKYHAIEFKTATGRQKDAQREAERETNAAGSPYAIARSCDEAIRLVNEWGIPHSDGREEFRADPDNSRDGGLAITSR